LDLFFDLLYVASAFKVSDLLSANLLFLEAANGWFGLFFCVALCLSLTLCWHEKVQLQARFEYCDITHLFLSVLEFLAVAAATFYIPTQFQGRKDDSIQELDVRVAGFSSCIALFFSFQGLRWAEICVYADLPQLSSGARVVAVDRIKKCVGTAAFFILAAKARLKDTPSYESLHISALCWFCGVAFTVIWSYFEVVRANRIFKQSREANEIWKRSSVPVSVHFLIHRFGELVMLLLGEGVLQFLALDIDVSDWKEFIAVGSAMLIIVLLNLQVTFLLRLCHRLVGCWQHVMLLGNVILLLLLLMLLLLLSLFLLLFFAVVVSVVVAVVVGLHLVSNRPFEPRDAKIKDERVQVHPRSAVHDPNDPCFYRCWLEGSYQAKALRD